jgi:hypothetical protein
LVLLGAGFVLVAGVACAIFLSRPKSNPPSVTGNVLPAKFVVPFVLSVAVTIITLSADSMHDIAIIAYPLIMVVATLLQGRRALFITAPFVIGALILLGLADLNGLTATPLATYTKVDDIVISVALVSAGTSMLYLLVQRLQAAVTKAEANEKAQLQAIEQLRTLQASLEKRVADRTAEIETANQRNEKRALQFEAIAQVARATTTNQNLESLLSSLANSFRHRPGPEGVILPEYRNAGDRRLWAASIRVVTCVPDPCCPVATSHHEPPSVPAKLSLEDRPWVNPETNQLRALAPDGFDAEAMDRFAIPITLLELECFREPDQRTQIISRLHPLKALRHIQSHQPFLAYFPQAP